MIDFKIGPITNKSRYIPKKVSTLMLLMTIDQNVTLRIRRITDRAGNPAELDGSPSWSSSDDSLVSLSPSDDGMTCRVETLGIGTVQINAVGDARSGEETVMIGGVLDIQIESGEARIMEIEAGELEPKE